ncbi:Endonuclease III [Candidatus Entotheonellaceae bacterium PAL068K]
MKVARTVLRGGWSSDIPSLPDRLTQWLGLTAATNLDIIEQPLIVLALRESWTSVSHLFIFHGRAICKARTPQCEMCPVSHLCPSATPQERARAAPVLDKCS